MITRTVRLQLLAFLVLTLVGVSYVGARYAGIDRVIGRGYTVAADLADSGGIFSGAEVTYRGVTVGRVGALRLTRDGVLVNLKITDDVHIPAESRAVVANRSAIGEQYVDLQPQRNGGPYLADGSRIPRAMTATPLPTTTLLVNLDRLVNSVDKQDLTTVIDELGRAFGGTGPALQRLIDNGDALTTAATEALPETVRLIEDGRTVLATQRASGSAIRSFSRDLALLTGQVKASDADLRKVLDNGIVSARQVKGLLDDNATTLPVLLANLVSVGQVQAVRLPGLEQILVTYPSVVKGGFTVLPGDGTAHFGFVLDRSEPQSCTAGYGGTRKRTPADTADSPANTRARCTAPRGSGVEVRGAANAPRPSGGAASALPRTGGAGRPVVAAYDPMTGRTTAPDGSPVTVRAPGGQQQVLGKDSWQWMLVGPLSA